MYNSVCIRCNLQEEKKGADAVEGHDEWLHGKPLIKPLDQVELTEAVRRFEILQTFLHVSVMLLLILIHLLLCRH